MISEDELLGAIAADPDNDAPRLVYADWLATHGQGERAELIRLQCQMARLPQSDRRVRQLRQRSRQLLHRHQTEWLGVPASGTGELEVTWRRGFAEHVVLSRRSGRSSRRGLSQEDALQRLSRWPLVRSLDLSRMSVPALAALAQLGQLEELILHRVPQAALPLSPLSQLSQLRRLIIRDTKLSPDDLQTLASLKRLQHLELPSVRIGDRGLEILADLPSLEVLNIHRGAITTSGLRYFLKNFHQLRELDLSWSLLDGQHLGFLGGLPRLCRLSLKGNLLSTAEELGLLTQLEELNLRATGVAFGALGSMGALRGLARLQTLNLGFNPLDDDQLRFLFPLRSLRRLDLDRTRITGVGLRHLSELSRLRTLVLDDNQLGHGVLASSLPALRSLRQLSLQGTSVAGAGLRGLTRLQALRRLDLGWTDAGSRELQILAGLRRLRELSLSSARHVNDEALRHLASLGGLESLDLSGTAITDAGLGQLRPMRHLRRLDLRGTGVSNREISRLKQALPRLHIKS